MINSGIDIVGDVPWGTRFCQFYQRKEDLADILVPYFKSGLENNEFCLWITSYPLEAEEATEALRKVIPDIDVHIEKGQIEIISYTCLNVTESSYDLERVINYWIEKLNHALESGYEGLRLSGNISWLGKKDWDYFVDNMRKTDDSIGKYRLIALSSYFIDRHSLAEIIEVVSNHQFSLLKTGGKWDRIDNFGWKKAEEVPHPGGQSARLKLGGIPSPAREIANLELSEIIDIQAIQSLMDDFYKFAHITMALVDLKGNVLVSVGWQDICTKFHRVHPESCKHCVESDTKLSAGISLGEFKLYRCKNNMWDIATPIMVGGQHVGNIFSGQFFFEGEPLDYELFRSQAKEYGFDEEEYITALEKVPQLSGETVDTSMTFLTKLANMLSHLSYGNIKLAQSLAERDALVDALQESEERFRSVLENSLDMAYRRNFQADRYDYISPVVKQISGFSTQETCTMSVNEVLDRIHPDDRSRTATELAQALDAGFGALEYRFRCKDGKYRWFADHFKVIKDQNGRPLFSGGIVRDITAHKRAEEALIRSEERFRTLAENSPDVIVRFDRQNRHIYANPAATELYGRSSEEIIGKTHLELGMDPELVKFWQKTHEKVFATGKPETMEFRYASPQGKECYVNTRVVPEFINGKVVSTLAISRDISDLKEAEVKLKETLDNLEKLVDERTMQLGEAYNSLKESEKGLAEAQKMAHIGNWDWDLITGEVRWSDEMYHIYGRNPNESGPTFDELLNYIHPGDRDYFDSTVKKGLKGEVHGIDYRITLANGEERTVHAQPEFIFDEKNIPIRVKGITQDITERKKAEEKIRTLADAVESSNDAIVTEALDGIITSWNRGAEQIYGYSAEEILGKNVSILEPDNIKGEIKLLIERVKQGEKIRHYETLRLKKDGAIINVSITLSPVFNTYRKLVAISAIARDITERKRAEEALRESEARLRRFYESNLIGVFYYNLNGSITNANDKFLELVGYTREDLQDGLVRWDKITPPEYRYLDDYAEKELKAAGVNTPYEKEYTRKDGSRVPIIFGATTFDQARNEGVSFVLDITKRKKAEEALARTEDARKKEIHHRIKNNLQVISSLLDLQAEKFSCRETVPAQEILEAFRESQNRVLSMSLIHRELYKGEETNTLNFSKYLQKLAENLFQTYSLNSKNIHLYMDLEENSFFDMDTAVPLGIIVNELVSNSLKHAFQGRDRGEIRIKLHREEGECLNSTKESQKKSCKSIGFTLTVSDNGVGFPENLDVEDLDSLGMQLVTILVDQLEGELELKKNNGMEFTIKFIVKEKDKQRSMPSL